MIPKAAHTKYPIAVLDEEVFELVRVSVLSGLAVEGEGATVEEKKMANKVTVIWP